MSTLNLDDEVNPSNTSKAPLIVRTIVLTILGLAILVSATANVYFYFRSQETEAKMKSIASSLNDIDRKLSSIGDERSGDDLSDEIGEVKTKLDSMQADIDSIKRDVEGMQLDVSSIESDVSSIQARIGY